MTMTDQLLCIAEATGSKIYTRESEVGTHSPAKALVLSLKQFHAHFYRLYEKGTTRAMVGFQGLHSSDAFWYLNVLASVGLKSFCPWCFKFRWNTKMIATHLREVHYRLAIACVICSLTNCRTSTLVSILHSCMHIMGTIVYICVVSSCTNMCIYVHM